MPQGPEREQSAKLMRAAAAAQWKDIRGMQRGPERKKAVAELKVETKAIYNQIAQPLVDAVKFQNERERTVLLQRQEGERKALATNHKLEISALSKQHIFERLGIHEAWRAYDLEKQSQRISNSLERRQDMPTVQTNAVKMIELHHEARVITTATGPIPVPENPRAAAKIYLAQGEVQQTTRLSLRGELSKVRDYNLATADKMSERFKAMMANASKSSTRQGKPANQNDARESAGQAVASGRTLTDGERANASPDLRERIDRQERSAKARAVIDVASLVRGMAKEQGRGHERSGGGRGR